MVQTVSHVQGIQITAGGGSSSPWPRPPLPYSWGIIHVVIKESACAANGTCCKDWGYTYQVPSTEAKKGTDFMGEKDKKMEVL